MYYQGDRNDEDDGDKPPAPPSDEGESGVRASRQKGKANPNTSKKKKGRRKKNRGKLLLDATVAPTDIKYPTDIDLLNKSREHLETAVNILWQHVEHTSHKLPYSAKKARKSYLKLAKSKKRTQAKCHRGPQRKFQTSIWLTTKKRLSTCGEQSLFIKMHNSSLALFFIQQILQGTQNRIGT